MTDFHIAKESEDIRHSFLVSEFDYIAELAQTPEFAQYYQSYRGEDIDKLSNDFLHMYHMMEEGKITAENEEKVELQMICCCLAIEDELAELIRLQRSVRDEGIIK